MDGLHVLPSDQPTLPGVLVCELAQAPALSKRNQRKSLRKAAGRVRTVSVSGLQGRFWLQERLITTSVLQCFLACLEQPRVSNDRVEILWPIFPDGTLKLYHSSNFQ